MKLLLDQGVPRSTLLHLNQACTSADHVGNIGMASADDEVILSYAAQKGFVIVTLDSDFHSLLAQQSATSPSVIRIRIQKLKGPRVADILHQVIANAADEIELGAAVSVTASNIRVRRLPLGMSPKHPK